MEYHRTDPQTRDEPVTDKSAFSDFRWFQRSTPPCASVASFNRLFIKIQVWLSGSALEYSGTDSETYSGNLSPNIGRPLLEDSRVASSWMTSQCSTRIPFSMLNNVRCYPVHGQSEI